MHLLIKQLNEVKEIFNANKEKYNELNHITMQNEKYLRCQDILKLLKIRGYISITDISTMSGTSYLIVKMVGFDEFEIWLKHEIKKERRLKRREWIIAIVSAAIGALIGLIPTFINLLAK